MAEIPKRPTDDWAPHAYAVDLIEYEHAVAVRAVEALKAFSHANDVGPATDWVGRIFACDKLAKEALRDIEASGWKP